MNRILVSAVAVLAVAATVLAEPGGCTFEGPRVVDVGPADRVVPIDVDGDGKLDLVGLSLHSSSTIAWGRGDGTFEPKAVLLPGVDSSLLAEPLLADVNGDGRVDFVTGRWTDRPSLMSEIVILYNEGQRRFSAPRAIAGGKAVFPDMAADFTNDGRIDLIDWSFDGPSTLIDNVHAPTVTLRRTNDFTGIAPPFVTGDFDADGNVDIVAPASDHRMLDIARGAGNGLFFPAEPFEINGPFTAGDVNGDGRDDIVVGDRFSGRIWIYPTPLNAATATPFTAKTPPPTALHVADFTRDGIADLAMLHYEQFVTVLAGDGKGGFTERGRVRTGRYVEQLASGDFDGNGTRDLVVPSAYRSFAIASGRGDGTFREAPELATPIAGHLRFAADFDGDGIDEIVLTHQETGAVLVGWPDGRGGYELREASPLRAPVITAGDVHPNPGDELIVSNASGITVYADVDRAWLPVAVYQAGPHVFSIAVAGRKLFVSSDDETSSVMVFDGDATRTVLSGIEHTWYTRVVAADFDGDGITDLAVMRSGREPTFIHDFWPRNDGSIALYRGRADGTFGAEERMFEGKSLFDIDRIDFDGDGDLDLAASAYYEPRGTYLLRNDGTGRFTASFLAPEWLQVIGDVDGDAIDDLVTAEEGEIQFFHGSRSGALVRGDGVLVPNGGAVLGVRRARSGPLSLLTSVTVLDPQCPPPRRRGVRH